MADNPYWVWDAAQHGDTGPGGSCGCLTAARERTVEVRPPDTLPSSKAFRGTGLAVLNSRLTEGKDNVQIVDALSERYDVTREVLMRDVQLFIDQILFLSRKKDLSPSATIGFESHVFEKNLSAPLRIDCCLTYRSFNEKDDASLTAAELTTEDWKTLLGRVYNAGIPHVIFFGGEPTLRADLTELMAFTEQLGLVSGLVTSDPKLKDPAHLLPLIEAGLDRKASESTL